MTIGQLSRRSTAAIAVGTLVIAGLVALAPPAIAVSSVNVDHYGAVADDGVDDGFAVRAAIDAAIELDVPVEVNFSSGVYRIDAPPTVWEFASNGDAEGWTESSNATATVAGGFLDLSVSGADPYITSPDHLHMSGRNVAQINLAIANDTAATEATIEWITQQDRSWDSAKSLTVDIAPNESSVREYAFPVAWDGEWGDRTIRQIRIRLEGASSGTASFDAVAVGNFKNPSWEFNQSGDLEGWTDGAAVTSSVAGGSLTVTNSGADHFIYSEELDRVASGSFKIRMKNNTSSTAAYVQFINSADSSWDNVKRVDFAISANDSAFKEYTIPMHSVTEWIGDAELRLDLSVGATTGSVDVDFIRFDNNNPDEGRYSLRFDHAEGLTLQGEVDDGEPQTTLLMTDGFSGAIAFGHASNTTLSGLAIDYETPAFSQGEITAIDTVNKTFDFEPAPGYGDILDDPRWAAAGPGAYGFSRDSTNPHLMKATGGDPILWDTMTKINSTTWRFRVQDWIAPKLGAPQVEVGDPFVITMRVYQVHGVEFIHNENVSISDFSMYASPEAGFLAWNNKGTIEMDNVKVMRKPGSDRWISTNADGVHFQLSHHGPVVTNSLFEGSGDDLLSFYAVPTFVSEVISSSKIVVKRGYGVIPETGDTIQIYNQRDGKVVGTSTISSVDTVSSYSPATISVLNLADPILDVTGGGSNRTGDLVFNLSASHPNSQITGSTFREGRRYGVWLRVQGALIQNNTFSDIAAAALDFESDVGSTINDGPAAVRDVEIIDNTFSNCKYYREGNYQSPQSACVSIKGVTQDYTLAQDKIMDEFTLSGNSFLNTPAMNVIYIGSAQNVDIVGDNEIINEAGDHLFANHASIQIEKSSNITIDGLKIIDPRSGRGPGIKIDKASQDIAIGTYNTDVASSTRRVSTPYRASTDFGGNQGPNWIYAEYDGSDYSQIAYDSGGNFWQGTGTFTTVSREGMHPDTGYDAVRAWHASSAGKVSIRGAVALGATGGNGVVATILKNGTDVLWSSTVTSTTPVTPTGVTDIPMNEGDSIQFRVNNNGASAFDYTAWDPEVDFDGNYEPLETIVYAADDGFTGNQGMNQWLYEQWDGSNYTAMPTYNSGGSYWVGSQPFTQVARVAQHPSSGEESVRTWRAPYDGTVAITGDIDVISGGNGVVATVLKNGSSLWQSVVAAGASATPTGLSSVAVSAGDVIRFRVGDNGHNAFDSTFWEPVITLTRP